MLRMQSGMTGKFDVLKCADEGRRHEQAKKCTFGPLIVYKGEIYLEPDRNRQLPH